MTSTRRSRIEVDARRRQPVDLPLRRAFPEKIREPRFLHEVELVEQHRAQLAREVAREAGRQPGDLHDAEDELQRVHVRGDQLPDARSAHLDRHPRPSWHTAWKTQATDAEPIGFGSMAGTSRLPYDPWPLDDRDRFFDRKGRYRIEQLLELARVDVRERSSRSESAVLP